MKVKDTKEVVEHYVRALIKKFPKYTWKDENTIEFTSGKEIAGTVKLDDLELDATGSKVLALIKELEEKKKKALENKVTEEKVKDTPLAELLTKRDYFGNLDLNGSLFDVVIKRLKAAKIEKVVTNTRPSRAHTICKVPTLFFEVRPEGDAESLGSGFGERLKTSLKSKYSTDARDAKGIAGVSEHRFAPLEGEKLIELKIDGTVVGSYYPERNAVLLYFNPFRLKKISALDAELHKAVLDMFTLLDALKLKKVDVSDMDMKLFVSAFLQNTRHKITEFKENVSYAERKIGEYEDQIRHTFQDIYDKKEQLAFMEGQLTSGREILLAEIEATKKLPFITKVDLQGDTINISFKESFLTFTLMRARGYGTYTAFTGAMTCSISPGKFKWSNTHPMIDRNNSAHPHTSGSNPCYGEGEGRKAINEMLAMNKFSELAKLLWFWVNIVRDSSAYNHSNVWFDDRLRQGLPIWDTKGNRVCLDDKDIEKKVGNLPSKHTNYKTNMEKFKDMKFPG